MGLFRSDIRASKYLPCFELQCKNLFTPPNKETAKNVFLSLSIPMFNKNRLR